jgi:ornithine cyclodeaminase/alanine dehydrogenase-like protein (mu-crystallin family)
MADWVHAVERAYDAAATGRRDARALTAIGAVASRYLAVGTPRTLATIVATHAPGDAAAAELSIEAHATWFAPRELRRVVIADASAEELASALRCDIVCIHTPLALTAQQVRRGTHINALAEVALDDDLRAVVSLWDEEPMLGQLAAGFVDGRQLDEITIFRCAYASVAGVALAT